MRKRTSALPILLGLVLIAVLTLFIDFSGVLKTQVLQTPESLSSVKLIRQKTDPVQFDIYYDQLLSEAPQNMSIVLVNSLIESGGRYSNVHQIIDQVLLQTGQAETVFSPSSETLTIKNIQPLATTKLGTIITRLKKDEYISLEYDTIVDRTRMTFQDNPVPKDFPLGYKTFLNPTSELLYVSTPGFHTILSFDEKAFVKTKKVPHGAVLIPNTLTTLQELDGLSVSTLINQPYQKTTPILTIEQNQIVLPALPQNDLNTLILRYRSGSNSWDYNYFLLSATKDITLKVPLERMLDFYTEVEYAFAFVSDGLGTLNLDFPYNSLLPEDQFPVFYRTDFRSFNQELVDLRNRLQLNLTTSIAAQENSIALGILTREPLLTLQEAVQKIEQKIPLMIFEDTSANFSTSVTRADQLPYFNLVGENNQIWSQKITKPNLSLVSDQFRQIPLLSSEELSELERVQTSRGDKLLCLLQTESGASSLATIASDIMLTTSCLESARRAGYQEGRIYPIKYNAQENRLIALRQYDFDATLSSQVPVIRNYDPQTKKISLNNSLSREKVRLMVSNTADFENYTTQAVELSQNSFDLPLLAGCETSCYFKVLTVIKEEEDLLLAYASETLLFAETTLPVVHLCFSNQKELKDLFTASELEVQILRPGEPPVSLTYRNSSGCYEYLVEEAAEEESLPQASLTSYYSDSEALPERTIVFHTNGLTNSHINIPPQRHYLPVTSDSLQQVLIMPLVFEHYQLASEKQPQTSAQLKQSYLTNMLGSQGHLITVTRGNIILQNINEPPFFSERIPVNPVINETVLYPASGNLLEIPNTIRFFNSDEVVIQGFNNDRQNISLSLPVPERSKVRLFLENVFRPNIQVKQLISEGIIYNSETSFISLQNPTGMISLPVEVSLEKPTDTSLYENTLPPTPPPADIDLATFQTQLVFDIVEPATIPDTSVLDPIILPRAQAGFAYEATIPLGGILQSSSFEIGESRLLTQACQEIFQFNPEDLTLVGTPPAETTLEACYFELSVRYLQKLAYAQIEVTTLRTYRVPLIENPNNANLTPEVIAVPIQVDADEVSQIVHMIEPIEAVTETTSEFVPKNNESELISGVGDLAIVFSPQFQQFIFSGDPSALSSEVSRYIQAIRQDTGELVLIEFRLVPTQQQEITLPVVQGFPNQINIPIILKDLGFTETEIATAKIIADSLTSEVQITEENIITLFALPELHNQVFSALLEKEETTPSALVEFDERLSGGSQSNLPRKVRIDLRLQVNDPETMVLNTLEVSADKNISIDLRAFIPANHVLSASQLPSFLTPNGYILSGRSPAESQELELLIQDYTDVKNYLIPLKIIAPEVTPVTDEPTAETPAEPDLRPAADNEFCFPDISDQPLEYREAICLAKQYNIIAGSNGRFYPNDPINRAEISKILVTGPLVIFGLLTSQEAASLNAAYAEPRFPDVPKSSWFYGFVETVKEVDIFSGYPDGSFKPANQLNKAEAAKVIVSTLLQLQPQSFPSNVLQANTIRGDQWFAPYVRVLNQNGGDLEDAGAYVELSAPITRAQFIYNLLILLDSKAEGIMGQFQGAN